MKKLLVKFSDERNRTYSIRTTIAQDETTGEKFVLKENVYPEGKVHMENILGYADLLKDAYPNVVICPVVLEPESGLRFAYIEGESMECKYYDCLKKRDVSAMQALLTEHKKIILGSKANTIDFYVTDKLTEMFGISQWTGCEKALKVSNFDATASNIIYADGKPVFIDYEWVCDFPIPQDLVIYHCILDMYLHEAQLEELYPFKKAMELLQVETDIDVLKKAYEFFSAFVIKENNGDSYALAKRMFLKGVRCSDGALEQIQQLQIDAAFFEENWKAACLANDEMTKKIQQLELDVCFMEKNWREATQATSLVSQQIGKLQQEVKSWMGIANQHAQQAETWRVAYETIVNSKTWRVARKIKKLFGRG